MYFGGQHPDNDFDCEDWRSRDHMWDLTALAVDFFHDHLPFTEMVPADALTSAVADYGLAKAGQVYAVYLPAGGTTSLNLTGVSGTFDVRWFAPRHGGALRAGTVAAVTGGATVGLGLPPVETTRDWVVLVRRR